MGRVKHIVHRSVWHRVVHKLRKNVSFFPSKQFLVGKIVWNAEQARRPSRLDPSVKKRVQWTACFNKQNVVIEEKVKCDAANAPGLQPLCFAYSCVATVTQNATSVSILQLSDAITGRFQPVSFWRFVRFASRRPFSTCFIVSCFYWRFSLFASRRKPVSSRMESSTLKGACWDAPRNTQMQS